MTNIVLLLQFLPERCSIAKINKINMFTLDKVYYIDCRFRNLRNWIKYHLQQMPTLKTSITCAWIHTNLSTFLASWAGKAPLKNISTAICKYAKILQTNFLNLSVKSTTCEIPIFLLTCAGDGFKINVYIAMDWLE